MLRWNFGKDAQQNQSAIEDAGKLLKDGQLVAFPTETVYGLGANALDQDAVQRIFAAKHRPADNPLIVHIADVGDLSSITPADYQLTAEHKALIDAFWPGPLTLLVPAGESLAPAVHPDTDTVGVRMPENEIARRLIQSAGVPIAAPSANTSGKPSPTTADDVAEDLGDEIAGLIDGGACGIGVESTVLLVDHERATILRPGGVTQEMIASVISLPVVYDAHLIETDTAPLAPGMKYRHYAPNARVHVWWGESEDIHAAMRALLATDDEGEGAAPVRAAIVAPEDFLNRYDFPVARDMRLPLDADNYTQSLASVLYQTLRRFDRAQATDILIHGVNPAHGIGTAVMNRLQKAAEGRVSRV